jgi:hypothetical protein
MDKTLYGECSAAGRPRSPIARGGPLSVLQSVNEVEIAKLEHDGIDPREIRHWRYVKDLTGGGHRVWDPVFSGERS